MAEETMGDATAADSDADADGGVNVIVLKVFMHCEACERKVVKSLKGFPGVEEVMADSIQGIVRVKGSKDADPVAVQGRVEEKIRRKVELIAPLPKHPLPADDDQKNEDEPAPATILLNIQMHCEACARVIRKNLLKIKGVESARTDLSINRVAVTGTVDANELVKQAYKRIKKIATVVEPPPTPPRPEDTPDSDAKITGGENEDNGEEEDRKQEDLRRNQIWPTRNYTDHHQYAPSEIFSDENPNACFIM